MSMVMWRTPLSSSSVMPPWGTQAQCWVPSTGQWNRTMLGQLCWRARDQRQRRHASLQPTCRHCKCRFDEWQRWSKQTARPGEEYPAQVGGRRRSGAERQWAGCASCRRQSERAVKKYVGAPNKRLAQKERPGSRLRG